MWYIFVFFLRYSLMHHKNPLEIFPFGAHPPSHLQNRQIDPHHPLAFNYCCFVCHLTWTLYIIFIVNVFYYSFKLFSQFSLAKSTCIIHHNQLLMTKSGRILCLMRKWLRKCSLLQVNAPLTEKTWGRDWVVFIVKTKMVDTSLVSRVRTTAGTRQNNG